MTYDELEAAGLCECLVPLDEHPPLPTPKPLSSWQAQHATDQEAAERSRVNSGWHDEEKAA